MILNWLEFLMMNNPVRAFVQKRFEGARLAQMGGLLPGGYALEIGCGRGVGAEIILDRFGAGKVDAVDLDPRMIRLAQQRLKDRPVRLWVGDVSRLDATDSTYDAVFDFGIVHHIPDWRKALTEVCRVLKPGGRFYAEEALRRLIGRRLCRILFHHPWEDRFDHEQFIAGLGAAGFRLVAERHFHDRFGWYIAQKPEPGRPGP